MANLPDSTLDPVFWLHHGVVDFTFTFWQARVTATHVRSHCSVLFQAWQHNKEDKHPTCRTCKTCCLTCKWDAL